MITRETVATLTHDAEKRKNIPTAEYQSVIQKEHEHPVRVAYERRNRDLDPQLVWRGKDEQDWSDLVVHAPPLYIQEKVHPKALIDDLLRDSREREHAAGQLTPELFADVNGMPKGVDKTEFYQHDQNWSNRMILGDSLQVMASLAEREGLRGKVQCIYIDPPYGIRFNSNFQWSTTSRDVKDGNAAHITREPEQVKAFRDTWRDGIHSYLSYLRERLTVARELLTAAGLILRYNRKAVELWGRTPQAGDTDARFCGSFRLWQPNGTLLPDSRTPMATALRTGEPQRDKEVVIERPDGSRIVATRRRGESGGTLWAENAGFRVAIPAERTAALRPYKGQPVVLGVRPEHTRMWGEGANLLGPFSGRVEFLEALGRETLVGVVADGHDVGRHEVADPQRHGAPPCPSPGSIAAGRRGPQDRQRSSTSPHEVGTALCYPRRVLPVIVHKTGEIRRLMERVEAHRLANPDPSLRFVLLSDFADAAQQHAPKSGSPT